MKKTPVVGGNEVILVAEDDPLLREIAFEILTNLGYHSILACDGVEALDIFSERFNEIDLVLIDVVMPRLSGKEAYIEMKRLKTIYKVSLCHRLQSQRDSHEFYH